LNVHWHVVVPDAVFVPDASRQRVDALRHRVPTGLDLEEIVTAVALRAVRWLERHGYLRAEEGDDLAGSSEADSPWMRCLRGSLGVGDLQRLRCPGQDDERGRNAGRCQLRQSKGLGARYLRFNLHAGVSVPGGLLAARERLLRYCARPPLALERLSLLDDGRVSYRIKDTEQVRLMTPMQFMARLAALVPPPRHPLVRFYGVWAPHSRWRQQVVPVTRQRDVAASRSPRQAPPCPAAEAESLAASQSETGAPSEPRACQPRPERPITSTESKLPLMAASDGSAAAPPARAQDAPPPDRRFARLPRIAWATLYQRVFDIDPLECASCGGRMRFVDVIEDVASARSELRRRNLPDEPPPLAQARSPDSPD
jgi:hypothetical protein